MQDLEIQSPHAFDQSLKKESVHKEQQPASGAADDTSIVTSDHRQQQPQEPGSESTDPCAQQKTQECVMKQQQDHVAAGFNYKVDSNNEGEGGVGCLSSSTTVGHGVLQPKKLQEQEDGDLQDNNKVLELEKIEISGRERLKRHRNEVAGHVWIPESWGQEECLKDWIDCSAFDSSLVPNGIMSARAALIQGGTRSAYSRRLI